MFAEIFCGRVLKMPSYYKILVLYLVGLYFKADGNFYRMLSGKKITGSFQYYSTVTTSIKKCLQLCLQHGECEGVAFRHYDGTCDCYICTDDYLRFLSDIGYSSLQMVGRNS